MSDPSDAELSLRITLRPEPEEPAAPRWMLWLFALGGSMAAAWLVLLLAGMLFLLGAFIYGLFA